MQIARPPLPACAMGAPIARVILREAHPGHAVTADVDCDATDFMQQFVFVGRADQDLIAGAAHAQCAVETASSSSASLRVVRSVMRRPCGWRARAVADYRTAIQHIGIAAILTLKTVFRRPVLPAESITWWMLCATRHDRRVKKLSPGAAIGRQVGRRVAKYAMEAFVPPDVIGNQVQSQMVSVVARATLLKRCSLSCSACWA